MLTAECDLTPTPLHKGEGLTAVVVLEGIASALARIYSYWKSFAKTLGVCDSTPCLPTRRAGQAGFDIV